MLNWIDKQDGIDDILAKDINELAHSIQDLQKSELKQVDQTYDPESENAQSGIAVAEAIEQANDDFANSLKGKAKGKYIAVKDATPFEHEIQVRINSLPTDNLFDISKLPDFPPYLFKNENETITLMAEDDFTNIGVPYVTLSEVCPDLKVGDTVWAYFNSTSQQASLRFGSVVICSSNIPTQIQITQNHLDERFNFIYEENQTILDIYIGKTTPEIIEDFSTVEVWFNNEQNNLTLTPDKNGIVKGLKSNGSSINMATNQTDKINIILNYKRNLNTVIDDIEGSFGDVETALDNIIAMQNALIGGDSE